MRMTDKFLASCIAGVFLASTPAAPQTAEKVTHVIVTGHYACWEKELYDKLVMEFVHEFDAKAEGRPYGPAKRDLDAAIRDGECFNLKEGQAVVVVNDHPRVFPDIQLLWPGEYRAFWTDAEAAPPQYAPDCYSSDEAYAACERK